MKYLALCFLYLFACMGIAQAFNLGGFNFGFGSKNTAKYVDLAPSLAWSPMSSVFGNTTTGKNHVAQFTITNSGNDVAEDVAVSTSSPFSLYSTVTLGNISSSRSRIVKVRFSPTSAGEATAYVNYSAPNIARTGAKLRGTGVEAATDVIFGWNGTYNATSAATGQTISGNGLTAGVGDDGTTTLINASTDYMTVGSLTASGGILSQSGKPVLDMNQATVCIWFSVTDNTVASQHLIGRYTTSGAAKAVFDYKGSATPANRTVSMWITDGQGTPNAITCNRAADFVNGSFHKACVAWDLDVNSSLQVSVDDGAWGCVSHTGTESSIVIGDFTFTNLYFGNQSASSGTYGGEISDIEISNLYKASPSKR